MLVSALFLLHGVGEGHLGSFLSFVKSEWTEHRHRKIARLPSRLFMQTALLPALVAAGRRRMLFVGARGYNRPFYRACESARIAVWSLDYDPAAAMTGAPEGHFVGDIRKVDQLVGDLRFDVIVFNGVLGWGIDSVPDALLALKAMAKIAQAGAIIVIGWNPGLTDERDMAALRPLLTPAPLDGVAADVTFPPRGRAQRYPHRYEIFSFKAGVD